MIIMLLENTALLAQCCCVDADAATHAIVSLLLLLLLRHSRHLFPVDGEDVLVEANGAPQSHLITLKLHANKPIQQHTKARRDLVRRT